MSEAVRDYSLDNLKWALTMLVILHHTAALCGLDPFSYNLPDLGAKARLEYNLLGAFQGFNQGYFMSLFFFISALFIPASLERKGAATFMRDRLKRYGIPVILTVMVILPIADILAYMQSNSFEEIISGYFGYAIGNFAKLNPQLGVAWFLWTLLVFTGVYLLWAWFRGFDTVPKSQKPFPAFWKIFLFACIMIPINFGALSIEERFGENFLGFHHIKYFPMYIASFAFGIVAAQHRWIEKLSIKTVVPWTLLAILGYVWRDIGEMVTRPFTVIGMSIFLIYSFRQAYPSSNKITVMLTRSAYAAYLIQNITITFVGVGLYYVMTDNPLANFFIASVFTVPLSFLVGHYLRQLPGLRKIL
ncbi:MAG: acyltransferase [Rhodobacteraceae bacterium]|nr:acyltransferase [Paracoccaceae bacterium]